MQNYFFEIFQIKFLHDEKIFFCSSFFFWQGMAIPHRKIAPALSLFQVVTEPHGQTSRNPWILPSIKLFSREASYFMQYFGQFYVNFEVILCIQKSSTNFIFYLQIFTMDLCNLQHGFLQFILWIYAIFTINFCNLHHEYLKNFACGVLFINIASS